MSRVLDLADRPAGAKPERIQPYQSLVSLGQTVGEALGAGPDSRRAQGVVAQLLNRIGPELVVLRDAPLDDLSRCAGAAVAEAVRRVRAGELSVEAGYDGEYGTIQIFTPEDRADLAGQISLLGSPTADRRPPARIAPPAPDRRRRPEAVLAEPEPLPLLSPTDPLGNLDPDQLRAARTRDGPLLIVAGPGTGKTRTLVARIAHQVKSGSVAPRRVLAISFTNQACEELQARLREALAPEVAEQILVATFHGFGRWLLREHGHRALEVIEDEARVALVREIAGPDARRGEAADLLRCVSLAKQSPDPEGALRATERELEVFRRYQAVLAESGLLDVDDLVLEAFRLLRDQGAIARAVAERFHSVSVDEYQDVNDVQAALVALLCPGGRTLCAIGDPDQAIYGFRGARPGHFLRFASTFPGARALSLTTTYRLTRQILEVARSVAGAAPVRRDPFHALCDGPRVEVVACHAPREEAEWIAARLRHAVGATDMVDADAGLDRGDHLADVGFGEVAVLVRTKAQRGEILEALGRAGIPARSVGEDEPHDPRSQKVAVMTLHAAKGREFPAVFVAGVESGLVPLEIEGLVADPEEERRLLYVAITRAKRLAVLSHCERRTLFGRPLPGGPSPFLRSLPAEMVKLCAAPSPTPKRGAEQLNLL
jgi:DNA helicase-2/ATP-dependent DNA helicase PcrA